MILAIEGAPGVGKSAVAAELAHAGAFVVPEVNLLFARPSAEPPDWYVERQAARWEMARLKSLAGVTAVLDGDPFQPLWFNWVFAGGKWPSWSQALDQYRALVLARRISFPDRYVFLSVDEAVRRERMLAREGARGLGEERAREKTERYARLVEPQQRFFRALGDRFPGWVCFPAADSAEQTAAAVARLGMPAAHPQDVEVLEYIGGWLSEQGG